MVEYHPYALRTCDACNVTLGGDEDGGSGLLVWMRGDFPDYEESPLCPSCGHAIGMVALFRLAAEEDGG